MRLTKEKMTELLENTVGEAIGHASTCWEGLEKAGEFQTIEALKVADSLINDIYEILSPFMED